MFEDSTFESATGSRAKQVLDDGDVYRQRLHSVIMILIPLIYPRRCQAMMLTVLTAPPAATTAASTAAARGGARGQGCSRR